MSSAGVFAFSNNAYPTPADDIDDWNAFATEMLFTFMLAFVILHVSTRDEVAGNGYFGLAIGLAYTAALIATGEISGCALNPAIGFCLLYTSPSPRDQRGSRMPSSA